MSDAIQWKRDSNGTAISERKIKDLSNEDSVFCFLLMEFLKQKLGLIEYITNTDVDDTLKELLDSFMEKKIKDVIHLPEFFSINVKEGDTLNAAKSLSEYMKKTYQEK